MPWFRFFPLAGALALGCVVAGAMADTPVSFLERFNAEARSAGEGPGNAARGQDFFNKTHGGEWKCASCHGAVPTGKDVLSRECTAREKAVVLAWLISLK